MTKDPACCTADAGLQEVAKLMVENDCGCIPVLKDGEPVGYDHRS
jgi:CBS domain-containing protein